VLLLVGCLLVGCTQFPSPAPRTTSSLYQDCLLCHSNREVQRGPILDGQQSHYLLRQLQKFKQGQRGRNSAHRQEALMGAASDELATADLERIADYLASLPPQPYQPSVKGDATKGKVIYEGNCLPCHGPRAAGSAEFKTGSLAVCEDWYLISQLRHFKNGRRGVHPDDGEGRLMAEQLSSLDDRALLDVVAYISSEFGFTTESEPEATE